MQPQLANTLGRGVEGPGRQGGTQWLSRGGSPGQHVITGAWTAACRAGGEVLGMTWMASQWKPVF